MQQWGPDKQWCQQGARGKVKGNILQGDMVSEMSSKQGSLTHKPLDKEGRMDKQSGQMGGGGQTLPGVSEALSLSSSPQAGKV